MGELREIRIPIIYHTNESLALEKMGVETPLDEMDVREMVFFNIDSIGTRTTDGYTCVTVGGSEYICPFPMEQVLKLIHAKENH